MEFPRQFIYAGPDYCTMERHVPAPMFRKSFSPGPVRQAELLITGLGFYDLFLNGQRITKGLLAPYISVPSHLVYYDRYDVTSLLQQGENVLGVLLGNGFMNNIGGYVWDFEKVKWRGAPRFALSLHWTDAKGETHTLQSDESFLTAPSPILYDDYRHGEIYDARLAQEGWSAPGFDAAAWSPARRSETPVGEARLCDCEPILVVDEIRPVSVTKTEKGYLYDFGVNDAGVCRLTIRNPHPGQEIRLYHGELIRDGVFTMENIKFEARFFPDDAIQRDIYFCRGEAIEEYTPTFTYHGFQYVLVIGLEDAQATPDLLTFLVAHSDLSERGDFSCSDEVVNTLQRITRRSDLSNFYYFPTDCPQREKNGWTGDAALSAEHMLLNLSVEKSLAQWLENIRKAQAIDGRLPGIIPTETWGYQWGNGPAWDGVIVLLPYFTYLYRGDEGIVRDNAAAMLRYLQYVGTRVNEDGLLDFGLGDWCQVGGEANNYVAPIRLTDTLLTVDMAEKAAYLFGEIGLLREREFALSLQHQLRDAVRSRLLDLHTMTAEGNCQTSQAMAIHYGMFEPGELPAAFAQLLRFIDEADGHLNTGVLGARVIFHVLSAFGRSDLAYHMIARPDYPSYGNWVAQGATTLWEVFRPVDELPCSLNHHFWGDISGWFLRCIAGIRVNPFREGADTIDICPSFIPALTSAQGTHQALPGKVKVEWKRRGKTITLSLTYPRGARGTIRLEPGYAFAGGFSVLPAQSGKYEIHEV